jgi:hypothetical protein
MALALEHGTEAIHLLAGRKAHGKVVMGPSMLTY